MMLRFQRVVPRHPKSRHADMSNRHPPLQLVMSGAMKNIRNPYGSRGCGSFQAGKTCRIIHHIIRQQNFITSAGLKVARRSVVEAAKYRHAGK